MEVVFVNESSFRIPRKFIDSWLRLAIKLILREIIGSGDGLRSPKMLRHIFRLGSHSRGFNLSDSKSKVRVVHPTKGSRGYKGSANQISRYLDRNLTIVFLDTLQARRVNWEFRKRNYATDILSFVGNTSDCLGELVICPQVISSQSSEHGLRFRQELGYMLVHGYLHLLGFDHETNERDARQMFAIQDKVFNEMCREFWGRSL